MKVQVRLFARYRDQQDIYDAALRLHWQQWFAVRNTIRVNVTAIRSPLTSIDFTQVSMCVRRTARSSSSANGAERTASDIAW